MVAPLFTKDLFSLYWTLPKYHAICPSLPPSSFFFTLDCLLLVDWIRSKISGGARVYSGVCVELRAVGWVFAFSGSVC